MTDRAERRRLQQSWEVVRSQILAHMSRCDVRAEGLEPASDAAIFVEDEGEPYYGPTREALEAVNGLLGLDGASGQAEWQALLGHAGVADRLVEALGDSAFDIEARSAIALLLMDGVDRGVVGGVEAKELLTRVRWHLRRDARVQARMRYWWTHMDGGVPVLESLN